MALFMEGVLLFAQRDEPQNSEPIFFCTFFFPDLWHLHLFVVYFSSHFVTLGTKLLLQVKGNV